MHTTTTTTTSAFTIEGMILFINATLNLSLELLQVPWYYLNLKPQPNDCNMPTQHVATCCVCLTTVLWCVATCWVLLAQVWLASNLSQQHPTCCNTVAKRTQHVALNNVATCCVGMLRLFGRGLTSLINASDYCMPCVWRVNYQLAT